MKAISLWQPWASALFAPLNDSYGQHLKSFETRGWVMPAYLIDQTVAIHAAKHDTREEQEFWLDVVMGPAHRSDYAKAFGSIGIRKYDDLPRGCIIGTVKFGRSIQTGTITDLAWPESQWGNYASGRFAWPVIERNLFAEPIPYKGMQGIFEFKQP